MRRTLMLTVLRSSPLNSESPKHKNDIDTNSLPSETQSQPRRSGRITKTPKWMDDYVPSKTL